MPETVLVNVADWNPPVAIPEGYLIANAPRPLCGPITWQGEFRHGVFYAAAEASPEGSASWASDDGWLIEFITNAEIERRVSAKLAEYGYASADEISSTVAEIAEGTLGLPWHDTAAVTT